LGTSPRHRNNDRGGLLSTAPAHSPLVVSVEWHAIPPLEASWELTFLSAVEDAHIHDIAAYENVAGNPISQEVDLVVAAFLAAQSDDPLVGEQLSALRARQTASPALRIAAAACGQSDTVVELPDVWAILCPDGQHDRRYAARAFTPPEFRQTMTQWVLVAAKGKLAVGERLPAIGGSYDPDSLIAQNTDVGQETWLGGL
jgi:hypothetical protein